ASPRKSTDARYTWRPDLIPKDELSIRATTVPGTATGHGGILDCVPKDTSKGAPTTNTTPPLFQTPGSVPADQPAHPIRIELTAPPTLSYPMAHNRVPVINRLRIDAPGTTILGATLTL